MKHIHAVVPLLMFAATALAAPTSQRAQENAFFPIMAWTGVPSDPAFLKKMHDCGINVAGPAPADVLDACQAAGIKIIVQDPRASGYDWQNIDEPLLKKNIASLVADTAKHPAVFAYYLMDEPHTAL